MGDAVRYLVKVMRDQHDRGSVRLGRQIGQRADELLPPTEIEARRWLVEQDHFGVVHERSGQQHALLFTRREGGE